MTTTTDDQKVKDLRSQIDSFVERAMWYDTITDNCFNIAILKTGELPDKEDIESWSPEFQKAYFLEQNSAAGRWLYHEAQPETVLTDLVHEAYPKEEEREELLSREDNIEATLLVLNKPEAFKKYLEESTHGGWEGFSNIELAAIYNMFRDFAAATKDGRI
jgi:hypothetical protein